MVQSMGRASKTAGPLVLGVLGGVRPRGSYGCHHEMSELGTWGGAMFCAGDVLCGRGLRFPTGHWGLNAVVWRRSTFPADIAVLDEDGWLLALEFGGAPMRSEDAP